MTHAGSPRLVVADDEADIRKLVTFTLRRRGHTVLEATNGDEAYDLIAAERPDLAILDVMMPGMTGVEVARKLSTHDELSAIPVVLLSAKGQAREIEEGLRSGASAYMVKPFSPSALAKKVDELLAGAGERHEETTHAP
jgi:two-component system, OmpR family, response regulator MtrA